MTPWSPGPQDRPGAIIGLLGFAGYYTPNPRIIQGVILWGLYVRVKSVRFSSGEGP